MRNRAKTGPNWSRPRDKALKALLSRAGSVTALAKAVGVDRRAASQWYRVPPRHAQALLEAFPLKPIKQGDIK